MVLAAPELVVAELVQVLHQVEVAAELQHRVLADRMVRSEERAEAETCHAVILPPAGPLDTSASPAEHRGTNGSACEGAPRMREIAEDKRVPADIDAEAPVRAAAALQPAIR